MLQKIRCSLKVTLKILFYSTGFLRSKPGKRCTLRSAHVLKEFVMLSPADSEAILRRNECEEYCRKHAFCWGCSVVCQSSDLHCRWSALPECGLYETDTGIIEGDVTRKLGM